MALVLLHETDLADMVPVVRAAFSVAPWNEDWSEAAMARYLREALSMTDAFAFGWKEGDGLQALAVGHLRHWYDRIEANIDEFCVHPALHRKGVGSALMDALQRALAQEGVDRIVLHTRRDAPACRFYEKHGFTEEKTSVAYARNLSAF